MEEMREWVEKDRKAKRQQAGGQVSLKYKCARWLVPRSDAEKSWASATPTHILISSFIAINFACFSILFLLHLSHTQTKTWILSLCIPVASLAYHAQAQLHPQVKASPSLLAVHDDSATTLVTRTTVTACQTDKKLVGWFMLWERARPRQ